jgi:hypothetical protein
VGDTFCVGFVGDAFCVRLVGDAAASSCGRWWWDASCVMLVVDVFASGWWVTRSVSGWVTWLCQVGG